MSWIAWNKVCSNSRCEGLGIGSLLATNFPMLSKGGGIFRRILIFFGDPIIQKFSSKLSLWKGWLLSVGGRLSLLKSVLGNLPTYYMSIYMMPALVRDKLEVFRKNIFLGCDQDEKKMSWVKWKRCLTSRKQGGLGIDNIFGLNIGLLFKWIWRFLANPSDFWSRVIQKIYGLCGSIKEVSFCRSSHSTWGAILSSINKLKQKGLDLLSLCVRKIGNGESTSFWNDVWLRSMPLNSQFLRVYVLDIDRNCFIANQVPLKDWSYVFVTIQKEVLKPPSLLLCNLLLGIWCFRTKVTHGTVVTHWNMFIPIKVNVFLWRLSLNKLPLRFNLDKRGVDVDSILCPNCSSDVETIIHILFNCEMAKDLSIIISIHGERDGFDYNDNSFIRLHPSPWKTILGINKPLLTANVDLNSIFFKRIGNVTSTRFWNDVWIGTTNLKSLFPSLHALETYKGCLVYARCMLLSGVVTFVWAWRRPIREGVERE
nr:RNA-directed DNA polymerase, eukaryota, reverse transcriptase zinc-binding domain protein [Tanacetum cinerariifolium]